MAAADNLLEVIKGFTFYLVMFSFFRNVKGDIFSIRGAEHFDDAAQWGEIISEYILSGNTDATHTNMTKILFKMQVNENQIAHSEIN